MPRLVNTSKKQEWAELLFLKTNKTQIEIAETVGVAPKTIVAWVKKYKWKEKKARLIITRAEELNRIYEQLSNVNNQIMRRPEEERYANNKEADIISKLTAAARNLENEVSVADIIDVFQEYTEWLRTRDLEKAKEHVMLMDEFIKYKMK